MCLSMMMVGVLSNTEATLEAHSMKKFISTEAELISFYRGRIYLIVSLQFVGFLEFGPWR